MSQSVTEMSKSQEIAKLYRGTLHDGPGSDLHKVVNLTDVQEFQRRRFFFQIVQYQTEKTTELTQIVYQLCLHKITNNRPM